MIENIKKNKVLILSFIIPIVAMCIVYYLKDIWPFGDNMYLRSDCYHQYAPFLKELYSKLKDGGSLLYSWKIGGGMNFLSLAAYYLASPLNILVLLFGESHIVEAVSFFIILKTGLSSLAFTYYLTRHFKRNYLIFAVFGLFYSMSAYFAAFSWNIMWLDCMVLLPIIILGLERLVNRGKCFLYCIALGIAIFSNYYIAIMICIYLVMYFVYLVAVSNHSGKKFVLTSCRNFAVYSLLAGGLAMCMVIPEYCTLLTTASGEFSFPEQLENYFSIFYMISRSLINVDVSIFEPHDPNLYCTVAVFVLLPLYLLNKKINVRERIGKTVLVIIFLLAFNFNIPNYIWHGLHFPNSLPCRQSFIYIFLILTLCCETVLRIKQYTLRQIMGCFTGAAALILVIEELYVGESYDFTSIYLSLIFIAVYVFLAVAYKKKLLSRSFIVYLIFVVAITESTINMNTTGIGTTSRSAYLEDNEAIEELLSKAELFETDLFYRTEKADRKTKNDAAWNQYNGMSTFSSTSSLGLNEYYESLGLETSFNAYAYYGNTPLTDALFSVKYVISNEFTEDTNLTTLFAQESINNASSLLDNELYDSSDSDMVYLYKNNYTLPLGFMVDEDINDIWDTSSDNPFYTQNSFVTSLTDADEIFTHIDDVYASGSTLVINPQEAADIYFYITVELDDTAEVYIYDEDYTLVRTMTFEDMNHRQICHVGEVGAGYHIEITPESETAVSTAQIYVYSFNEDNFIDAYDELNGSTLELTTFSDTYVAGSITADDNGIVYTSIPYDEGWTVYVDGVKTESVAIKDGVLGVYVDSGSHLIEFKYFPQGLVLGIIISCSSLAILIIIAVFRYAKAKKRRLSHKD